MSPLKKIIASVLLLVTIVPIPSVMALTLQQAVNNIQAIDPNLPTGVANPKGSIGFLLAELFYGTGDGSKNGKIKPQYIDYSGISAWTQSGSDAFYSGTGNVGIGTVSPGTYKLNVNGTSFLGDTVTTGWGKISWSTGFGDGTTHMFIANNSLDLRVNDATSSIDALFIKSNGNVWIGTASPSDILTLSGSSGPIIGLNGSTANYRGLKMSDSTGTEKWFAGANNTGNYVIRQNAATDLMTFSGGNVGIGTSIPGAKLDVAGTIYVDGDYAGSNRVVFRNTDTTTYSGKHQWDIYPIGGPDAGLDFYDRTIWWVPLHLGENGYVGIGTTNPQSTLDVNGQIYVHADAGGNTLLTTARPADNFTWAPLTLQSDGSTYMGGMAWMPTGATLYLGSSLATIMTWSPWGNAWLAGTLNQASDIRLKKEITPIESPLEKISSLNGVTYYWKDPTRDSKQQIGVIAQDVEKVFPEAVATDEKGMKSVAYGNLVAPLIEAVKELSNKIDNLFRKYLDQQKEIDSLKSLVCLDHPGVEICR